MDDPEPIPPWLVRPGQPYGNPWDTHGDRHVRSVWRPYWDLLNEQERAAYLTRFPPAHSWDRFLQDVAMDQEVARIDAEDIASGVLQPNGLPWPETPVARPSLWRRLFRRR